MSVWVAVLAAPFLLLAGLVVDGGGALVAKQRAADEAGQAARAGANQLDLAQLRAVPPVTTIDPVLAAKAINDYFALTGDTDKHVSKINPDSVKVTVTVTYAPILLSMFGYQAKPYSDSATARPISK